MATALASVSITNGCPSRDGANTGAVVKRVLRFENHYLFFTHSLFPGREGRCFFFFDFFCSPV